MFVTKNKYNALQAQLESNDRTYRQHIADRDAAYARLRTECDTTNKAFSDFQEATDKDVGERRTAMDTLRSRGDKYKAALDKIISTIDGYKSQRTFGTIRRIASEARAR